MTCLMPNLAALLTRLRELEGKATPAPWRITPEKPESYDAIYVDPASGAEMTIHDMNLIDASRNVMGLLLDVVEAAARIPEMSSPVHRLMTPGWDDLRAALSRLAAAEVKS